MNSDSIFTKIKIITNDLIKEISKRKIKDSYIIVSIRNKVNDEFLTYSPYKKFIIYSRIYRNLYKSKTPRYKNIKLF